MKKMQRLRDHWVCDSDWIARLNDLDEDYIESLESEIARLKSMSLDEFCLWQKGIEPTKIKEGRE